MKRKVKILIIFVYCILTIACDSKMNNDYDSELTADSDFPVLHGPYLGQKAPGEIPEVFAPGIISKEYNEVCISFTEDAEEMFFSVGGLPHSVIFRLKEESGKWTKPEVASFSGKYGSEFVISGDGSKILIGTDAPDSLKGDPLKYYNIWVVSRIDNNWSEAVPLKGKIKSDEFNAVYPTISKKGNIFFCSAEYPGIKGGGDILMAKENNDRFDSIYVLSDSINTENWELDPFIAKDESYILFSSKRPDGQGGFDLYISFKNKNGSWSAAKNMGNVINSKFDEMHPYITLDEKYLFFCSNKHNYKAYSEKQLTYSDKIKILESPENGNENLYWVDAKIIEKFR